MSEGTEQKDYYAMAQTLIVNEDGELTKNLSDLQEQLMGFANQAKESYGTDNILNAAMQTNSVVTKVMSMVFSNILTAASVIADAAF